MRQVTWVYVDFSPIRHSCDGRRFGADLFLLRDVITATTTYVNTELDYSLLERVYRDSPASGAARKTAINSLALVRYCWLITVSVCGLLSSRNIKVIEIKENQILAMFVDDLFHINSYPSLRLFFFILILIIFLFNVVVSS